MFSRNTFSNFRTGNLDSIEYTWVAKDTSNSILIAICDKFDDTGKLIGTYSAYKQAGSLHCDPEEFAKDNNWYTDLEYEIAEQIDNNPFGHFDLETYISIHNTSIRTRA